MIKTTFFVFVFVFKRGTNTEFNLQGSIIDGHREQEYKDQEVLVLKKLRRLC